MPALPASLSNLTNTTMPLQSTLGNQRMGLRLLSLDAGGTRGISQLKILTEIMHRLNYNVESYDQKRPCDAFDIIAGVGSGGFIAILIVVFGLKENQLLDEFIKLSVEILERQDLNAETRMAVLKNYISEILDRYEIGRDRRLLDPGDNSINCKLVVPISYKCHVGPICMLRNFSSPQGQPVNLTIAEALLATLATPPLFTPISISKDAAAFEYISGDLSLGNPISELITEAYQIFGPERLVACLLSLGCGHPGVILAPDGPNLIKWNQFLSTLVKDSEQKAEDIDAQMGHLGLYYRFCVIRGLEQSRNITVVNLGELVQHATVYLTGISLSQKIDRCVESLQLRDGISSLEQLKYSGGQRTLAPALPPPTRTFVMRRGPWERAKNVLIGGQESAEYEGQRILVVTGIGGCGKSQLMRKFIQVHKNKFASSFFIDGSSEARIRSDIIRHVRSLSSAYSQMGFDDCMVVLSQPSPNSRRIIVYDNVDDPSIDIASLLPDGEDCAVAITSRNRSICALCPNSHLELDKMSMDEAVDVILYERRNSGLISNQAFQDVRAIAQELDCLPIALQQARSYMLETRCSATTYLKRLDTSRDKLLSQPVKYQRDMRYLSTYAAFEASFEQLDTRSQQLLRLLSYFYWSKFPLELIALAAQYDFYEYQNMYIDHGDEFNVGKAVLEEIFLRDGKWDPTDLDGFTISLQNYSLVTLVSGVETLLVEIHPLLHRWVHSHISEQEQPRYRCAAIVLLALGAREQYTPATQYLASHATHLSSLWDGLHINNAVAFGCILYDGGLYKDALRLQERVVEEIRRRSDLPDGILSNAVSFLANAYRRLGRLAEASGLWEELFNLNKEILGERHPSTITASSNLANIYCDLGRHTEALVAQEWVLRLRKEILGEQDPHTISASNNLAYTYSALGRHAEALVVKEEVLRLRKQILGEWHLDTIKASGNLARTYSSLQMHEEALVLDEEVLRLRKEKLGEQHPATIRSCLRLGQTYSGLGRHEEALVLKEGVFGWQKEILGQRHQDTCRSMLSLAKTYQALGKETSAAYLLKQVEPIILQTLGTGHSMYKQCQRRISRLQGLENTPILPVALTISTTQHSIEVLVPSTNS